jgi:hypothetical protein
VSSILADRPQAPTVAPLAGGTLEALVRACLDTPEGVGCLVCGGALAPVAGGLACGDCGSELARGAEPRRVVRTMQR